MKKEKQVRSYKRRTKSGKIVTVKAHTAKYDAADEKAKEVSKKPGAGKELEERKGKWTQLEIPFDKEEEKKVLDEVKDEEKKPTSKKSAEKKTTEKKSTKDSSVDKRVQKAADAAGFKIKPKGNGEYLIQMVTGKWRTITGEAIISQSAEEVSLHPSWKESTKKVRPVGSGTNGPTPKRKSEGKTSKTADSKNTSSEPAFTAAEFKEWYRGTGSAADKKVAKALRAQLGRAGYRKLEDEAIDNYSSRGHLSMFKRVSGGSEVSAKSKSSKKSDTPNSMKDLGMRVNKKGEIVWTSDRMKHPEKYKGAWEKETSKSGVKEKAAEKDTSKSKTTSASTKKSNFEKYKISDLHDSVDSSNPNGNMGEYGFFPIKGPKNTLTYKHRETGEIYSTPANSDEWGKGKLYKSLDAFRSAVTTKTSKKSPKTSGGAPTSADLRKRADEMDAREKKAKIAEKVGKRYKTIKNAQLNNPAPNSRTATLRGNVYISSDGKTAYYEDPTNKGKLKKASAALLSRLTKEKLPK